MIERFLKTILWLIWLIRKPIHWLFIEETFFILEEKHYRSLSYASWHNGGKEYEIYSTYFACTRRRWRFFSHDLLDLNGYMRERESGSGYGGYRPRRKLSDFSYPNREQAEQAIETYRTRRAEEKTIKHVVK